jgi:hypothetical protein
MNPTKTKYARERASEIKDGLRSNLRAAYAEKIKEVDVEERFTEAEVKDLTRAALVGIVTDERRLEALIKRVKYESRYQGYGNEPRYKNILNVPNLSEILQDEIKVTVKHKEHAASQKVLKEELKTKLTAISDEHNKVMDKVVLGDESEAFAALEAYAASQY